MLFSAIVASPSPLSLPSPPSKNSHVLYFFHVSGCEPMRSGDRRGDGFAFLKPGGLRPVLDLVL